MKVSAISLIRIPQREPGRFCQNLLTDVPNRPGRPPLVGFPRQKVRLPSWWWGTELPPAPALPRTHEASWRPAARERSQRTSRFLKQTQQGFSRGQHDRRNPETGCAGPHTWLPGPDRDSHPWRSDLGPVAPLASASVSPPRAEQLEEARLSPPHFRQTLHSWEFLSPPADPGAAGGPTVRGGPSGRGPRGGAVTRGCTPDPRPRRRRSARAASQVAPLLFYLPGCLFFAEYQEKRRRERGSGALLPAAGARSPRAQPARGGSGARPPSPTGAGPVAAPPRAALRLRCPRCRPSPRLPRSRRG